MSDEANNPEPELALEAESPAPEAAEAAERGSQRLPNLFRSSMTVKNLKCRPNSKTPCSGRAITRKRCRM